MFTATDIADIKREQNAFMDVTTATIRRPVGASDGQGGETVSWNNIATNVTCRVLRSHRLPRERMVALGILTPVVFEIVFPSGQDVTPKDQVLVGSHVYEVHGDNNGESYQTATVAICSEIQT
jgi:hypothetical protein